MKIPPIMVLSLAFATAAMAQSIEVTSTGNVGIGTAAPATSGGGGSPRTLEIVGTSGQTVPWGQLVLSSPAAGSANDILGGIEFASRGVSSTQRAGYIYSFKEDGSTTSANAQLAFGVTNGGSTSTALTIRSSGNVGVGTTAPAASIDIWKSYSAGTDSLRFSYNDGNAYWMGIQSYVVGGGNVGYKFRTNNLSTTVDAMAITGAGHVGIGTTTPGYPLQVVGSVRASSFIADVNTYSDFVFKPGYRLAPLAEVAQTIAKEGHLPGIPSEAEAKRDGIDVAQMEAKLLQKVEELTLHQIDQEKRLNEQARRIHTLEAENLQLRDPN